ncbi:hypothetical protein [Flavobacterium pallidum]|uniref:HTH cro/C1-type domain-containing protein n=1 Tax=Flavobacterium pallidum TaxID=2172098 RepID=A0A2S1SHK5_9FLAO|nr:hypothetical protein [Flavobacterium pallidum]AWI25893.1 hypothetical protein HYN49_08260 [Flavobacterium pallidum]
MINRTKKYKAQEADAYPPIGMILKEYMQERRISAAAMGKKLGVTSSSFRAYFDRESLQMGIIWKISLALKHNFMAELGEQLPVRFITENEKKLLQQIEQKDLLIEKLENEIAVYRKVIVLK